jgi:hypothetical protein
VADGRGFAVEVARGLTVGYVIGGLAVDVAVAAGRGVGMGDAIIMGVAVSRGGGIKLRVSFSVGTGKGVAVSMGAGVAVASGLTVALGEDFGFAAGEGFVFVVGVGVSSEGAGVLTWKGVEAASCARTDTTAASSTIARTNRRILSVSPGKNSCSGR